MTVTVSRVIYNFSPAFDWNHNGRISLGSLQVCVGKEARGESFMMIMLTMMMMMMMMMIMMMMMMMMMKKSEITIWTICNFDHFP